ncbi:adenylate/guanylate cyclase domain-containing protein [Acetobacter fallax]|uniref:GAF domain-containing protein n=1 Tax=Acetobacter fallax TaxID=1737473 RepID=A0ABX0K3Z9_9PROT|nr:cache domain-containing protein [Acetobacter fallax]NHO31051.1 GAF domain-containing protein [Acetobacter fallax]NHO34608.1 GAF domain-containing protein [Acetobacter fallax]
MTSDEIIDPTSHSDVSLRRKFIQVGVPVLGVLLILATIGGIGWHTYQTTREGVLQLTRQLLTSVQRYVVQDVSDYLAAATLGGSFAKDFVSHAPPAVTRNAFYAYGASMLRLVPQIQSYYLADQNGGFILVERDPNGKGLEYTELRSTASGGIFHHEFRDEKGKVIRTEENPADNYDPRVRAWYANAINQDTVAWSAPTIYLTTRQLVITASTSLTGNDGLRRVFAINVSLNLLSQFLDGLKISQNGNAIILDGSGHIIAGHDFSKIVARAGNDPSKMVLDPNTQGAFQRVYDRYRVRGVGSHPFTYDDKNYIGMAQTLPSTNGWVVLIVAPENDFASFARQSGRESLQFSIIIVVLAVVLAGLLARQSRRTEHVNQAFVRQKAQTDMEAAALQQVAISPGLLDVSEEALVLTEELTRVTGARRASLWRMLHDGTALICEDNFDARVEGHSGGFELSRKDMEDFFKLLDAGAIVSVTSAGSDPRTASFERSVMRDAGTRSLMVCPIRGTNNGRTEIVGVLTLEDARSAPYLVYFLEIISAITAIRFSGTAEVVDSEKEAAPDASAAAALPAPRFDETLMQAPTAGDEIGQGLYPSVAVMVITFSDPVMESDDNVATLLPLIDRIASEVQDIARRYNLFSVKVAGHRLICMAGCTRESDPTAVWRLAEAALALRETCMMLLSSANIEPIFSIGMDFGPAMGGELGSDPKIFNLWGETVTLAELMAQGAPDVGTIEVTERVYQALRNRYLFRSRGSFYAPRSGTGRVYVLASRR